jgi:hypothetical protein
MGQAEQQTYTPVAGMGQQGGAPAAGGQEQYAMGGVGNGNGAGQSDFWEEVRKGRAGRLASDNKLMGETRCILAVTHAADVE